MISITKQLLSWYHQHGRHDLPWQNTRDTYRIWLSEIMLQQTQVATVIPYYLRFIKQYPTLASLAQANIDDVLHLWTGLGYYARARNLHKAAQQIQTEYNGAFPKQFEQALALPGIGRSSAGAILAFAYHQPHAILDGNVKRVLARFYAIEGWHDKKPVADQLWTLAQANTPTKNVAQYNQAIMDFGATLCKRSKPNCTDCPLAKNCQALAQQRVTELPHGKAKAIKPVKQTTLLFIQNDKGEVLLQRRPPSGIWGGLWCPPQIPYTTNSKRCTVDEYQISIDKYLPSFRHSFSHYHLDISPALAHIKQIKSEITENREQIWYNLDSPQPLGLAAPIKALLEQIGN